MLYAQVGGGKGAMIKSFLNTTMFESNDGLTTAE